MTEDIMGLVEAATPGPWRVGAEDHFNGIEVLHKPESVPIANVPMGYTDRDGWANARLIAAAPDLARKVIDQANTIDALKARVSELEAARKQRGKGRG